MELEPPIKQYLKDEILAFLKSQLRGTIFRIEDLPKILSERLGWEVTLKDVREALDELYNEEKVTFYVRL